MGLSACSVENTVEPVLQWPKFLAMKKCKLALEETFVMGEDVMRAPLAAS